MNRRLLPIVLAAGGVWAGTAGCETPRSSGFRSQSDPALMPAVAEEEAAPEATVAAKFFKPTRRRGAWSSEAGEIEQHLGVDR